MTVTIDRLEMEWIGQGQDAEEKPCLYFADHDQSLVLNVTNANAMTVMHGDDYDTWGGKQITLYPTQVQFGSKMVDAVRVKVVKKSPADVAAGADDDGFGDLF